MVIAWLLVCDDQTYREEGKQKPDKVIPIQMLVV